MLLEGFDDEKLRHAIIQAPRGAFVPLPEMEIVDRPGRWKQLTTPSMWQGALNEVTLAVMDEAGADEIIDATIAGYRQRGLKFRWTVGPDSRPADLPERLARRGLTVSWSRGMARPTAQPIAPPGDGLTVTAVGETDLDEFTRVAAEGWNMAAEPLHRYHRAVQADTSGRFRLWLARRDGVPAAAGVDVVLGASVHLMGAVTLPAHRGHGLYRALISRRLAAAAASGVPLATTHARETTSAPILERLGFVTVARLPSFSD